MITGFEVGAVFKLVDEVTQPIRRIKEQIRELIKTIKDAETAMGKIGGAAVISEINKAIVRVDVLAESWGKVTAAAEGAGIKMAATSAAAARATSGVPLVRQGGSARQNIVPGAHGRGGGGGLRGHIYMPAIPLGPGVHGRLSSTPAMAGAGALGYGLYEAAQLQDEIYQMIFHAGVADTPEQRKQFRDLIQNTSADTGFSYHDVAESATDVIRLLKGTPGRGLDVLPELLQAAATESRLKKTPMIQSTRALIELAHMEKEYDPEAIKKAAPMFAFLSTANPATLPQMTRAASYAMPTLQSALGMDPADILMMGTALARAGATNTKSGTWVRAGFERALPPDPKMMSAATYGRRMYAMKRLGLADEEGKSTILDPTGHIDINKLMTTLRDRQAGMGIEEKNALMKGVFGEQGQRGMSILSDPKVMEQMAQLKKEFPAFAEQYKTFMQDYRANSIVQLTRTTWQDLTNVLADIGEHILPPLTVALRAFAAVLKTIHEALPPGITGAGLGGTLGAVGGGMMFGPPGAIVGGIGGSAIGGYLGSNTITPEQERKMFDEPEMKHPWPFNYLYGDPATGPRSDVEQPLKKMSFLSGPPTSGGTSSGSGGDVYLDGTKVGSILMDVLVRRGAMPVEGSSAYDQTRGALPLDISTSYPG